MPINIPLYMCAPFVVLLLLIALLPLLVPGWWEKNRNKAIVAAVLSIPVLLFLVGRLPQELGKTVKDYLSFIILLASLFIISGGILLKGDLKATPLVNSIFLVIGAVLANLIGTTGASMLLIRPLLRTNSERKRTMHIPVFFIFIVSNIGGSLTPLGDPPLFLGYLNKVPFAWTLSLFPQWLMAIGIVLMVFFVWDSRAFRKEELVDIVRDNTQQEPLKIQGKRNILFLLIVIVAVFAVGAPYRELLMVGAALLSLIMTKKTVRVENKFTFNPILEVAILFAGIFITMIPLLTLLTVKGAGLGITKPWQFFWLSGGLTSFLDNAPTYLTFTALAKSVTELGHHGIPVIAGVREDLLRAISCGSVFMGANSYIGNGPNFMVKAIAEEQGMKVPHFFQYMIYSGLVLIPTFILITFVFFR